MEICWKQECACGFMVGGGGGNAVLHQLQRAGFDWMDIHHISGIIWIIRVICQSMYRGEYQGEAHIYGHDGETRVINGKTVTFFDIGCKNH